MLPLADAPLDVVLVPLELAALLCGLLPEDAGLLDDVLEDQFAAVDREQAVREDLPRIPAVTRAPVEGLAAIEDDLATTG